jgi:hypothetical protein
LRSNFVSVVYTERSAAHAQGIEAEILFFLGQEKKIAAESRRHAPPKGGAPGFRTYGFSRAGP